MERQPVHTVYGGAHLFRRDTAAKLGAKALEALTAHAPDPYTFARILGLTATEKAKHGWLAEAVHVRVKHKLQREPVEDYRIDFEDGFGWRSDAEEDAAAAAAAGELAQGLQAGSLPPFIGFRVKAFGAETRGRAERTLALFLRALADAGRRLPPTLFVTLPKVASVAEVESFVAALDQAEAALGFPAGALRLELMVETPAAVRELAALARAGRGRVSGAHFGAYDYTAALGVMAAHQSLDHPACDFARQQMQLALADTRVVLADGATTLLPVGTAELVHRGWRLAFEDVRRALRAGFYQGWDLHPAQLPARYAAVYGFFLDALAPAAERLKAFVDRAARATRQGHVFDDAATGQGLLNFFLRGAACGALTPEEVALSGLAPAELATRSFAAILRGRSGS